MLRRRGSLRRDSRTLFTCGSGLLLRHRLNRVGYLLLVGGGCLLLLGRGEMLSDYIRHEWEPY